MKIRVRHRPGRHYARFRDVLRLSFLAYLTTDITLHFDKAAKYDLDKGDQYDWNKAIGRGGFAVRGGLRKNEDLIVWRYIRSSDEFHASNEYRRRNYQMLLPQQWESVKGEGSIRLPRAAMTKWPKPLAGYFGGNRTAPCFLSYHVEFHFSNPFSWIKRLFSTASFATSSPTSL